MPKASTLEAAQKVLDPRPLDFSGESRRGGVSDASNPEYYRELPVDRSAPGGLKVPGPIENLRRRLRSGGREKLFLSGHIGSGKSTELSRLAVHHEIVEHFTVVQLRFEEQEWATLDSAQILFRLGAALFEFAKSEALLSEGGRWQSVLGNLNERIYGATGLKVQEGSVTAEFNLLFFKLRQELKLSEKTRRQFRELGESEPTLLQDLLRELSNDIEQSLATAQRPARLLLLVDDLDKVRGAEQQREIFETHLNALLSPPIPIVYTIPTGVFFGEDSRPEARSIVQHLFPVRVLKKSRGFNPEDAYVSERSDFFTGLVHQRVEPHLIEPEAIRLAAIYSGGVLREFFRLLREGIGIATYNDLGVLDALSMQYAIVEARRNESAGLYAEEYATLEYVHRTNELKSASDRRLLDLSRVLECYNAAVWFEANPLLWKLLENHGGESGQS